MDQWLKTAQLMHILEAENAKLEIASPIVGRLNLTLLRLDENFFKHKLIRRMNAIIEALEEIRKQSGLNFDDLKFTREELLDAGNRILMVCGMIQDRNLELRFPPSDEMAKIGSCRPMVAGPIIFKTAQLAYHFSSVFELKPEDGEGNAALSSFGFLGAAWIPITANAYGEYEQELRAEGNFPRVFSVTASVEAEV